MKKIKDLLVIIPHSGLKKPKEIKKHWLSSHNKQLIYSKDAETDRGTKELYDFRKILGNKQLVFQFSQIYINICRAPDNLDESIPNKIRSQPIYKKGKALNIKLRRRLIKKYYLPFYKKIRKARKSLILNGHSMIAGHGSLGKEKIKEDIVISDWLELNKKKIQFAPKKLADFYAKELRKRLPELKIGRNSVYTSSYDYICASFGTDKKSKDKFKAPVIHQETSEELYIKNNKIDYKKLNILKKAFAESLKTAINFWN